MQRLEMGDLFFRSPDSEGNVICTKCDKSFQIEDPNFEGNEILQYHLVNEHFESFQQVNKELKCVTCDEQYIIGACDHNTYNGHTKNYFGSWLNDKVECEYCNKNMSKSYVFFKKHEYLSEWYEESIVKMNGKQQDTGSVRNLKVWGKVKGKFSATRLLFKLDYSIDWSYPEQSHAILKWFNGKEFTQIESFRMSDFINAGYNTKNEFFQKMFESEVHDVIENFREFV